MAEKTQLMRPVAGQDNVVPVGPDAKLEFAFDQGDANLSKDGQSLVFTFGDGGKLTLDGFYDNFGDNAKPPTLIVEGNELPGEAFLRALSNPDLMPAAGPANGMAMGGGSYEDASLAGVGDTGAGLDAFGFNGWGHIAGVGAGAGGTGGVGAGVGGFVSALGGLLDEGYTTDVSGSGGNSGSGGGGSGSGGGSGGETGPKWEHKDLADTPDPSTYKDPGEPTKPGWDVPPTLPNNNTGKDPSGGYAFDGINANQSNGNGNNSNNNYAYGDDSANTISFTAPNHIDNNYVSGGIGDDVITFTATATTQTIADNHIYGGDGADTINIYGGNSNTHDNTIYGGAGDDHITFSGSNTHDNTIYGGDGKDIIDFSGIGDNNKIFGGAGDDIINFSGHGSGNTIYGGDGDDIINFSGNGNHNVIYGGAGNDHITVSGSGDNVILGGAGNDTITISGSGHNTLFGGDGNDTFEFHNLSSCAIGTKTTIGDFQHDFVHHTGDVLRLDDLITHDNTINEWTDKANWVVMKDADGITVSYNVGDAHVNLELKEATGVDYAELTVNQGGHSQVIDIHGDFSQFTGLTTADHQAAMDLMQDIIKVGGNA